MSPYGDGHCGVATCTTPATDGNLMCKPHWFAVPLAARSRVWRAFKRWQDGSFTLQQLREAQDAAVASITPEAPA